jgi:hypothetical protein
MRAEILRIILLYIKSGQSRTSQVHQLGAFNISRKIDDVLDERTTTALIKMSQEYILELYKNEPDLYSVADLKARY